MVSSLARISSARCCKRSNADVSTRTQSSSSSLRLPMATGRLPTRPLTPLPACTRNRRRRAERDAARSRRARSQLQSCVRTLLQTGSKSEHARCVDVRRAVAKAARAQRRVVCGASDDDNAAQDESAFGQRAVLSTSNVSILASSSSDSALRTRMPLSAPRPTASTMAMGVASPIAHGHAMTSTATA